MMALAYVKKTLTDDDYSSKPGNVPEKDYVSWVRDASDDSKLSNTALVYAMSGVVVNMFDDDAVARASEIVALAHDAGGESKAESARASDEGEAEEASLPASQAEMPKADETPVSEKDEQPSDEEEAASNGQGLSKQGAREADSGTPDLQMSSSDAEEDGQKEEKENKVIEGTDGDDVLQATASDEGFRGFGGADVFVWSEGAFGGEDTILDFDAKAGDRLDFSGLSRGDDSEKDPEVVLDKSGEAGDIKVVVMANISDASEQQTVVLENFKIDDPLNMDFIIL